MLTRELTVTREEIETYRSYITELKQKVAVYVPIKTDVVDKRIAEYINNYPDRSKLKVMFVREAEGVYKFGSKRVNVRVDKEKINIRVGGGYMTIDEFLDQYTHLEVQALERQDPMKALSDKIELSRCVSTKGREVADVKSPAPTKQRGREVSPCVPILKSSEGIRTNFAKDMR